MLANQKFISIYSYDFSKLLLKDLGEWYRY